MAFALGTLIALGSFAFFFWGLAHYVNPYPPRVQYRPPSLVSRVFQYFWVAHFAFSTWQRRKGKKLYPGFWPKRPNYGTGPMPQPENARATEAHRSESGGALPSR